MRRFRVWLTCVLIGMVGIALAAILLLVFIPDPFTPVWSYKYQYVLREGMTLEEVKGVLGPGARRLEHEGPGSLFEWEPRSPGEELYVWKHPAGYVVIWVWFRDGRVSDKRYHHFE